MKKFNIIGYLILVIILSITFVNIFTPNKKFSNIENRELESKPEFNFTSIIDDSYFKEYNKYVEDQFANRSFWMGLKTKFEKFIGRKKIDNIYFGKDNLLIEEMINPTEEFLENRINNINFLREKYSNKKINFILVPNKIGIYKNQIDTSSNKIKLYDYFKSKIDKELFKINTFDVLEKHKNKYIYYKTDHHLTTLGSKYIYDSLYDTKDIKYDKYLVNNTFKGTDANKIAYYKYEDSIEIYKRKDEVPYYLTYNRDDKDYSSIYDKSKQFSANPYDVFFGGNTAMIDIRTTSKNKEKLLILKDSYANNFIPFLLNDYREIIIIDSRYFFDNLDDIIKEKDITDIMLYYNMNTFFEDITFDKMVDNLKSNK